MKNHFKFFILIICFFAFVFSADSSDILLKGTPISSEKNITEEELGFAFSKDLSEGFISKLESGGWIGLELENPSKITKIGWAQSGNSTDYLLGIFEGANDKSFYDAVPLFMITKEGKKDEMNYQTVDISLSFKYVRYVGPAKKYCIINGFEVYGATEQKKFLALEAEEDTENIKLYQPTNIPLVVIHIENSQELTTEEQAFESNLLIIDGGKLDVKGKAKLKLRGNSTLRLLKKSYKWTFEEKLSILDFPVKSKKWSLLSNHQDRTLIRNMVAFKVSSLFNMKYSPRCRAVDVMVNGEYKGTYNLCEQIEVQKGKVEITEMDETCNEEPEITGGYMLELDGGGMFGESDYRTAKRINYNIKYPDKDDLTKEQLSYIQKKFNEVEAEVYDGIVDNIDFETFTNFFLIEEYCGNIDAVWSSYYITKEREDDKIYFGPVWDFDLSLDNDKRLYPTNSRDNFVFKYGTSNGNLRKFVITLLSNEDLLQAVKDKWEKVTSTTLTKEALFEYVDNTVKEINESQKLNFMRWDIMHQRVFLDKMPPGSFEAEIDILKKYIEDRFEVLGSIISNTTVDNAGEGVNELRFDPYYGDQNDNQWGGGGWGGWGDWDDNNWPGWGGNGNNNGTWPNWGGNGNNDWPGWGGNGNNNGTWPNWGGNGEWNFGDEEDK